MKINWILLLLAASLNAQLKPQQQPLPDEFFNRNDTNWYNRKTGSSFHFDKILKGESRSAIEFCKTQLPDKEADFL